MLNLDGKDEVLPVILKNEHYQEQMQALQQQLEQAQAMLEQSKAENTNLKQSTAELSNALATMGARTGGQTPPQMGKEGESAIVGQATNNFGMQTGEPLPT